MYNSSMMRHRLLWPLWLPDCPVSSHNLDTTSYSRRLCSCRGQRSRLPHCQGTVPLPFVAVQHTVWHTSSKQMSLRKTPCTVAACLQCQQPTAWRQRRDPASICRSPRGPARPGAQSTVRHCSSRFRAQALGPPLAMKRWRRSVSMHMSSLLCTASKSHRSPGCGTGRTIAVEAIEEMSLLAPAQPLSKMQKACCTILTTPWQQHR